MYFYGLVSAVPEDPAWGWMPCTCSSVPSSWSASSSQPVGCNRKQWADNWNLRKFGNQGPTQWTNNCIWKSLETMIWDVIEESLETMIWDVIGESLETMIWDVLGESLETMIWDVIGESLETMMWDVIGESLETIDWIMFLAVLRTRNYLFSAPTQAPTPASAPTIYCHLKLGKFRNCRYLGKFGNHVFRNSMKTIYWQMIFGEIWKPWNEECYMGKLKPWTDKWFKGQ